MAVLKGSLRNYYGMQQTEKLFGIFLTSTFVPRGELRGHHNAYMHPSYYLFAISNNQSLNYNKIHKTFMFYNLIILNYM